MSREPVYVESLLVKLDRSLKDRLRREAFRRGTTMSRLTRRVLRDYLDGVDEAAVRQAGIERMRGSATTDLSTDEIMALTRGE